MNLHRHFLAGDILVNFEVSSDVYYYNVCYVIHMTLSATGVILMHFVMQYLEANKK